MSTWIASTDATEAAAAGAELVEGLHEAHGATLVVFFAHDELDGAVLGRALSAACADAAVLGCSTNGQFSAASGPARGAVAIAFDGEVVRSAHAALAPLGDGAQAGVDAATKALGEAAGAPLRALDPTKWIGLALLDGAKRREEAINEALGNVAPLLPFVGGSAGDQIQFASTWVVVGDRCAREASALALIEPAGPFTVLKTCNYVPGERTVKVTKLDPENPSVFLELDGHPAAEVYAEICGVEPDALDFACFSAQPLGLMIDDAPWLRSPVRTTEGGGVLFACTVVEGTELAVMERQDLVADTERALAAAREELGADPAGALLFNCAYRMIEAQTTGATDAYHAALKTLPHAGMHTNGETYLGHINQTLTGLLLGRG